jgi:hypothetical protein
MTQNYWVDAFLFAKIGKRDLVVDFLYSRVHAVARLEEVVLHLVARVRIAASTSEIYHGTLRGKI